MIWKQFSKFLQLDDDLNSVDRFIELLRKESSHELQTRKSLGGGEISPINVKHENRKSTYIHQAHVHIFSLLIKLIVVDLKTFIVCRFQTKRAVVITFTPSVFRKHSRSTSNESKDAKKRYSSFDDNRVKSVPKMIRKATVF